MGAGYIGAEIKQLPPVEEALGDLAAATENLLKDLAVLRERLGVVLRVADDRPPNEREPSNHGACDFSQRLGLQAGMVGDARRTILDILDRLCV